MALRSLWSCYFYLFINIIGFGNNIIGTQRNAKSNIVNYNCYSDYGPLGPRNMGGSTYANGVNAMFIITVIILGALAVGVYTFNHL